MNTLSINKQPLDNTTEGIDIPLFAQGIQAGFPSPAADFMEDTIDLNKYLIRNGPSTFIARSTGKSMIGAGIDDNDLLIIDKSLPPLSGRIAVCVINNEFTLKRLLVRNGQLYLMPENNTFEPIRVTEFADFEVWGILTHSIKHHLK